MGFLPDKALTRDSAEDLGPGCGRALRADGCFRCGHGHGGDGWKTPRSSSPPWVSACSPRGRSRACSPAWPQARTSSSPAATGEHDYAGAGSVLNNSLLLSLILGLVFGAPGYLLLVSTSSTSSRAIHAVAVAGTGYMQWRFIGLMFFLFVVSYRGFFNGIGHTKVFMYSAIIINFTNIALDYVLIFGAFGIRPMGLTGAGAPRRHQQRRRLFVLPRCNFSAAGTEQHTSTMPGSG